MTEFESLQRRLGVWRNADPQSPVSLVAQVHDEIAADEKLTRNLSGARQLHVRLVEAGQVVRRVDPQGARDLVQAAERLRRGSTGEERKLWFDTALGILAGVVRAGLARDRDAAQRRGE